jgi:hypothetical protein
MEASEANIKVFSVCLCVRVCVCACECVCVAVVGCQCVFLCFSKKFSEKSGFVLETGRLGRAEKLIKDMGDKLPLADFFRFRRVFLNFIETSLYKVKYK